VRYELTRASRLNNTDRVQDVWYVAANVLRPLADFPIIIEVSVLGHFDHDSNYLLIAMFNALILLQHGQLLRVT